MTTAPPGKLRPLEIARDLDGFGNLVEIAFTGELVRRGVDIHQELNAVRRLVPIIKLLGWLSADFRHLVDGYVWEDDGKIVGSTLVQRMGHDKTRWYIAAVAVHPDYRRHGIARRLIEAAIAHARTNGATACILDVGTDNAPAYALYTSLGFVHYDGTSEYKLEAIPDRPAPPLPPGYSIRPWKRAAWRIGYELALAETPARAQEYLPVREGEYRTTVLQRALGPFLTRLQGLDQHRYIVVHSNRPVATLRLVAERRNKGTHDIHVQFDPAHRGVLAEPLISRALALLTGYPTRNILITVRTEFTDLVTVLEAYGFTPIEHTHRLGLKLAD